VNYGATETGTVAIGALADMPGSETAAGFVCPWADIEILDPAGVPVSTGQVGEIRIRSPAMTHGYLDDPADVSGMFRDGWFCSGDLGFVDARGLLHIEGRTNDLMNIGGSKFLAPSLESLVIGLPGVMDAAAFVAPDEDGLSVPHLAYVAGPNFDLDAVHDSTRRAVGGHELRLIEVRAIPRNAMGKVRRHQLQALVRSLVTDQA
jgi:acyl-coenzyme A synthetase/AMP-(fatty) acid ligase